MINLSSLTAQVRAATDKVAKAVSLTKKVSASKPIRITASVSLPGLNTVKAKAEETASALKAIAAAQSLAKEQAARLMAASQKTAAENAAKAKAKAEADAKAAKAKAASDAASRAAAEAARNQAAAVEKQRAQAQAASRASSQASAKATDTATRAAAMAEAAKVASLISAGVRSMQQEASSAAQNVAVLQASHPVSSQTQYAPPGFSTFQSRIQDPAELLAQAKIAAQQNASDSVEVQADIKAREAARAKALEQLNIMPSTEPVIVSPGEPGMSIGTKVAIAGAVAGVAGLAYWLMRK